MTKQFLDAKNNIQITLKLVQLKFEIGNKHKFGCQFQEDPNNRLVTDSNNINDKKFSS